MREARKLSDALKTKGAWLLLVVIVIAGATLRLYDIRWDSGIMAHPDERSTVAFYAPTIQWPSSLAEALDPHQSPLNPFWDRFNQQRRSYTYGHLPLYLLVIVANLLHSLAALVARLGASPQIADALAQANTVAGFLVVGRSLAALFDTVTLMLVFLIGRKLYGQWAGVLAAALSAVTVTQIQLAHFFAVDPISATFTFLALYGAILMAERDNIGAALLTGVAAGLAVASKFSALPIMAAPVVACVAVAWKARREGRSYGGTIIRLVVTCLVALAAFAVTSPYVFLDFGAFLFAVVKEQGAMVRGAADLPFTRQYRGTLPYIYFIEQQIRWGMGWALGLGAFIGLGWVIIRGLMGRIRTDELILMSWVVPYFGVTGLFLAKFTRYMVPVIPLFTIMGAGLLVALWRQGARKGVAGPVLRGVALLLIVLTLAGTAAWAAAFVNGVYGSDHPWVQASRWIYANVPDGSALGVEHWDDNLPFGLPEERANIGAHGYRPVELPMYEDDTEPKYELLKERLREADYIILASNRLYRTIPRLPKRYPMSTRYYQYLFSGQLGFDKVIEFTAYPRLGPLVFNDDAADESFTVYDHPKPIIFKKNRELSDEEWERLLGGTWEEAVPGYVGTPPLLARLWGNNIPFPSLSSPSTNDRHPKKSLLLDQPVDSLPVVDDFRWNASISGSTVGSVAFWWLVVLLVGWVGWPLTFVTFRNLADRGYILSKSLTLLVIAYLVWLPASFHLARNSLPFIFLAIGLIVLVSVWLLRQHWDEALRFWQTHWKVVLVTEVLFAGAYLLFVGIRLLNPDLWQPWLGGEKFMDFAFLNATLKSAYFPPYDPYFAGGYLNYYYYGQYAIGIWFKLAGIKPTVGFNLVIPTLFALTVGNSFCLGYNLLANGKRRKATALAAALIASVFVAIIGNLDGFLQIVRRLGDMGSSSFHSTLPGLQAVVRAVSGLSAVLQGSVLPIFNYWDPTRVIPFTINEFPFFSFLFADLHPHMINMPFALLFMALLLNQVRRPEPEPLLPPPQEGHEAAEASLPELSASTSATAERPAVPQPAPRRTVRRSQSPLSWMLLPLVLGALAAINTWDFPTYWGLAVLVYLFKGFWRRGRFKWVVAAISSGLLAGISLLLYWPFFAHYQAISVGLDLVTGQTDLGKFLSIWGLFLFITGSFLFLGLASARTRSGVVRLASLMLREWSFLPHTVGLYRALVHKPSIGYRLTVFAAFILCVVAAGMMVLGYGVIALLCALLIPAGLLLARRDAEPTEQFACLLAVTGLIVLVGCEIFYMKDFLGGGDWKRMNTLFKFYIQVWLLLGIASAALLPQIMNQVDHWRSPVLRWLWNVGLTALLVSSLVYPVLGTGVRVNDRFPGERPAIGTLDGMAFMTVGSYSWPEESNRIELKYDYEAIQWLMDNLKGTPVVVEAALPYYREGGLRVSSMTGFPTLLGMHQNEQRYDWQVGERDGLAREFYNTPSAERAMQIIEELHISYIYVGKLERTVYDGAGIDKFDRMAADRQLRLVFSNPEVKIYEVAHDRRFY